MNSFGGEKAALNGSCDGSTETKAPKSELAEDGVTTDSPKLVLASSLSAATGAAEFGMVIGCVAERRVEVTCGGNIGLDDDDDAGVDELLGRNNSSNGSSIGSPLPSGKGTSGVKGMQLF